MKINDFEGHIANQIATLEEEFRLVILEKNEFESQYETILKTILGNFDVQVFNAGTKLIAFLHQFFSLQ